MSSQFPDSLDSFTDKVDNVDTVKAADINNLQDGDARLEGVLHTVIKDDDDLLTLCHYENRTSGYRGLSANEDGAVRYKSGKYDYGVYVEQGATNYVKNPGIRESDDLWTFSVGAGSMSSGRVTSDYPPDIDTGACLRVTVEDAGNVEGYLKTGMDGLASGSDYMISFWTKNTVSGSNFSGTDMKIADSGGGGASGSSFSVTSSWNRVSGSYSTGAAQDTYFLEVHFEGGSMSDGDELLFGGFQVEDGVLVSSYCDGDMGTGYVWTDGQNSSSSIRSAAVIEYPVSSSSQVYLDADTGSIGFWMKPDWGNSDSDERYFFDTASSSSKKRISIFKDTGNKLNFKILEPDSEYALEKTDSAVDWEPTGDWLHLTCVYDFDDGADTWGMSVYVDGQRASTSSAGNASTSSALQEYMYLGCSKDQDKHADAVFDDFFTYSDVLNSDEVQKIYDSPIQKSEGVMRATIGEATTSASIGVATAVAHNLGMAPAFVEITEKCSDKVYLSDADDFTNEYFYVKSTGASSDFMWRAWAY